MLSRQDASYAKSNLFINYWIKFTTNNFNLKSYKL